MIGSIQAAETDQLIDDRYRLVERIGAGGMGEVWRAVDSHLDREVAIKLLPRPTSNDSVRSADDEARFTARLAHPNIVHVYDIGTDDRFAFIVMELVAGQQLDKWRVGQPIASLVEITAQVADALEHAHQSGIVHCDVTPRNVIVTNTGAPKLLDFGIAEGAASTSETSSGEIFGSLPYTAPEQLRGEPVDARTDIYALGVVLYEMVTSRLPFGGASSEAALDERVTKIPTSPGSLNAQPPPALDAVILRALAAQPSERFASAAAFRDALRAALTSAATAETQRFPPVVAGAASSTRQSLPASQRARPYPPIPLIALAVMGVAIAGWIAMRAISPLVEESPPSVEAAVEVATPTPEPTVAPTEAPAIDPTPRPAPPANEPPLVRVGNPAPPPQPKTAPAAKDPKEDKKDDKKPNGQAKGHGRD